MPQGPGDVTEFWQDFDTLISANPRDPYNSDAFRIIFLTEDEFSYEHMATENRYTLQRVSDDFELPEPE